MGFMDKMKAAAQDAAGQAKKATAQAQKKMEEAKVRKKMDESAKKLGYLIYRERTEGTPARKRRRSPRRRDEGVGRADPVARPRVPQRLR